MGHTIQHYDYPGNADTKKVEQELANYVAKRCFQEGGHLSKIRWIDSEPCANEDEARIKIEHLDKGWGRFVLKRPFSVISKMMLRFAAKLL